MKFAHIHARAAAFPIEFMCRCLGVSRFGYYNWRSRAMSEHERRDLELSRKIEKIFEPYR